MNIRMRKTDGEVSYTELGWQDVLSLRLSLLIQSDLWMLADRYEKLTEEQKTELTTYRQALRDITDYETANLAGENFPDTPNWVV